MTHLFDCIRCKSMAISLLILALVVPVSGVYAQEELPVPIRNTDDIQFKTFDFTFVRIQHSGNVWATDWPAAEENFSAHVQNLTPLSTNNDGLVLELTDPNLSQYPFIEVDPKFRTAL